MNDFIAIKSSLRAAQLFGEWPDVVLLELAKKSRLLKFDPGQVIIAQGAMVKNSYVVLEGRVEVNSTAEDGRIHIRHYAVAGAAFGLLMSIDGKPSPYGFLAHKPSRLVAIPDTILVETLEANPHLWKSVVIHFGAFHRLSMVEIDASRFESLSVRLASALILLAEKTEDNQSSVAITQEDLAKLFAVSRQTISKELKRLSKTKLVSIEYRRIILHDVATLRHIAKDKNQTGVGLR